MEAMQDKLIREKLNSLDSLPEGYAPSLESKWEILRGGKPEKKKTPNYFWYAAAASLLLLLSFGVLFWQTEKPDTVKTIAQQEISTEKITPKISVQKAIQPDHKPEKTILASTATVQKNGMFKPPKTVVSNQKAVMMVKDPALKTPVPTQVTEEPPVLIAENSKAPAKKKNRYVELDFDAPETPQRLPQPVQTAQLQLKIRILPQTSESGQTSAQAQNPLRLQHTF